MPIALLTLSLLFSGCLDTGGNVENSTLPSYTFNTGGTTPTTGEEGDLFYNTATDQLLVYDGSAWNAVGDNLGNHTASQNIDLGTNKLVGNSGTVGLAMDSSGKVGIGSDEPNEALDIYVDDGPAKLLIRNVSSSTTRFPGVEVINYHGGNAGFPRISFKNGGGSLANPSQTLDGDNLGSIAAFGSTGSSDTATLSAFVRFTAADDFSSTEGPARITFGTRNSGSAFPVVRMSIVQGGQIGMGTSSPDAFVHIDDATSGLCVTSDDDCSTAPSGGEIAAEAAFSTGADYAEFFEAEKNMKPGEIVGLNKKTGFVRPYKKGDPLIGVVSEDPGFVGNSELKNSDTPSVLVALMGQVAFNQSQVRIAGGSVKTTDNKIIGHLLASGKVYLQISQDNSNKLKIIELEKKIDQLSKALSKIKQ